MKRYPTTPLPFLFSDFGSLMLERTCPGCLTRLLIWKLKLPLPHHCGASGTGCTSHEHSGGPLGGLAASGGSEPDGWPQLLAGVAFPSAHDAHCTSCTAQDTSPGTAFDCALPPPQNWAPAVTPLLPEALVLCPATQLHCLMSTQMCSVVLRIPWR